MKMKYWAWLSFLVVASCNDALFLEEPIMVKDIDISKLDYGYSNIMVYKSISNATTNESIQLRVKKDDGDEKVVMVYERYDMVISHVLEGISLRLILQDTSGVGIIIDTISFDLSSLRRN